MNLGSFTSLAKRVAVILAMSIVAGCSTAEMENERVSALLVGSWAEVVTSPPADSLHIRQLIERLPSGRFQMIYTSATPSSARCTGRWEVSGSGKTYRQFLESTDCLRSDLVLRRALIESPMTVVIESPEQISFNSATRSSLLQKRLAGGFDAPREPAAGAWPR